MFKKLTSSTNTKNPSLQKNNSISFEALPGERKSRPVVGLCVGCSSCCCCCCCAHAAGGVIGAAVATKVAKTAAASPIISQQGKYDYNQQAEAINAAKVSVQRLSYVYWIAFAVFSIIGLLLSILATSEATLTAIVYFAFVAPLIQGLAFFISLPFLAIVPDRSSGIKALLKILGGSIVGMIIGVMLMIMGAIVLGIM